MPPAAVPVTLTASERKTLKKRVRGAKTPYRDRLPAATGVPLSGWTGPELAAELTVQGLVSAPVTGSSLLRILAQNPVKSWQYQSWIYQRDPDFAAKATPSRRSRPAAEPA